MSLHGNEIFTFDDFRLDVSERRLERGDRRIELKPKTFELLRALLENPGRLLTKEELMRRLWPDSIVEEANLTRQVWLLRRALGEQEGAVLAIETVPKAGYRFVPDVHRWSEPIAIPVSASAAVPPETASPRDSLDRRRRYWGAGVAAGLATFILCGALISFEKGRLRIARVANRSIAVTELRNLTGNPKSDWLARAIADILETDLAAGGELSVVPVEALGTLATADRGTAAEVKRKTGADIVITGSVTAENLPDAGRTRLDIRAIDASGGKVLAAITRETNTSELLSAVASAGRELRDDLGATAGAPPTGTQNLDAARSWSVGERELNSGDARRGVASFEAAARADPEWPSPRVALAEAFRQLGIPNRAREEARRARELSAAMPWEERQACVAADAEARDSWNEAISLRSEIFARRPHDVEALLSLAHDEIAAGRGAEATVTLAGFRKAHRFAGSDPRLSIAAAEAAAAKGDFRAELDEAGAAEREARSGEMPGWLAEALLAKGDASDHLGSPAEARACFEQARVIFAQIGNLSGVGRASSQAAGSLFSAGDLPEARHRYDEALAQYRAAGNLGGIATVESDLADINWNTGHTEDSERLLQDVLAIRRETENAPGIAWALDAYGNLLTDRGELARAESMFREAAEISRRIGKEDYLSVSLENLGCLKQTEGDLAAAKAFLTQSIEIVRRLGEQDLLATRLCDLGGVLIDEGDLAGARAALDESLVIRTKLGEKNTMAETQSEIAVLLFEQARPAEAGQLSRSAAEEFAREGARSDEAEARACETRAEVAENRLDVAAATVSRAETVAAGNSQNAVRLPVALAEGWLALARHRTDDARRQFHSVLERARSAGWVSATLEARLGLARCGAKDGEPIDAVRRDAARLGFESIVRRAER